MRPAAGTVRQIILFAGTNFLLAQNDFMNSSGNIFKESLLEIIFDIFPKVILVIIGFSVFMLLLAAGSGWRTLAEFYQADRAFEGKKFYFQSASLRYRMGYNNILTFGANGEGIHVSAPFPFAIGHPPLFFPWRDVVATTKPLWWTNAVMLEFNRCPSIPVWISIRLADKLVQASGGQFIKEQGTE